MKIAARYPSIFVIAMIAGTCFLPAFGNLPFTDIASINIPDIILYYLLLLMVLEKIRLAESYKRIKTPLDFPVVLFFLVALANLLKGKFIYSYKFLDSYLEFKVFVYYLIAIIVPNIFLNEKKLASLFTGCFFLAISVSLTLIIRSLTSLRQISSIVQANFQISENIYYMFWSQGGTLVFWVLCCLLGVIIVKRITLWYLIGAAFCSVFIILSFSRHWWLSLFFSALIIFFITCGKHSHNILKLTSLLMIMVFILSFLALSEIQPFKRYKELLSYRLHSLEWVEQTGSYTFRKIENEYAIKKIKENPLFGIGFTRTYRPQIYYPEDRIRNYVHNGYLWILLKMGIIGFIPFIWFSYLFVKRGLKNWNKVSNIVYRGIILGSVASYLGIALGNLASPHFTENWEAAVFALSFGVNEVIYKNEGLDSFSDTRLVNSPNTVLMD